MVDDGPIFISYAKEDKEVAKQIIEGVEKAGYKTWYYERDSLEFPGAPFIELVTEAITQCQAFILVISENSIKSGPVDDEVIFAKQNNKPFIPVLYKITYNDFKSKKPSWVFASRAVNVIDLTSIDTASMLQRILNGFQKLGIQPSSTIKKEETKPSSELPKKIIVEDEAPMVLIPAGEFLMGDDYFGDAKVHPVSLDAFYIDKYEVTNAQYKKFMDAKGHEAPAFWNDSNYNAPNQPVVGVTWEDAKAYAEWAGKRLPTEAEWEKAARGGFEGKKFVWGDEWPPPKGAGNFADETAGKVLGWLRIINGYDDGYAYTAPVGSFKPNGYGLYDMAGNVWEWCEDQYDPEYYAESPKLNPPGPSSGSACVLRGGSWYSHFRDYYLRVAYRFHYVPSNTLNFVGFRCVGL